jgi:23S rRNA (guanosine2251-2'-O)-methyltransferase
VHITTRAKAELQKYCGAVVHQGVVAQIPHYHYIDQTALLQRIKTTETPLIVLLDQIQDTHNLGAIIRTAEICGVTALVIPEKTSAAVNPTVIKTSAGAVFHQNIHQTRDISKLLSIFKQQNLTLFALMPGSPKHIYQFQLNVPLVLLIGSEGAGLRKNLAKACDQHISIPQIGHLDSLNASVSTAVVLFEIMRQRNFR